jgi:lipopolysaccharide transport system ATP-binding protein
MDDIALRIIGLSKRYRIGQRDAYRTLREVLSNAVSTRLNRLKSTTKEQYFTKEEQAKLSTDDWIWALKDISFEVRRGEAVGIVGPNGAGKSTLLKILSRITDPSAGRVEIYGRVSSLLEVGTGFNPELTGRENIFVNGTMLGMRRAEVARKFDEIVNFSEVEPFLDTPVKRYSSGMHMRLAFAVAAHLETDILLVDEVLAVGDAAFQKKCLGRMGSVAREGRTVLFVSHHMPAILSLCNRAIHLNHGRIIGEGAPTTIVQQYLEKETSSAETPLNQRLDRSGDGSVRISSLQIESTDPDNVIRPKSRLKITIGYHSEKPFYRPQFVVTIYDAMEVGIYLLHNDFVGGLPEILPPAGKVTCLTEPINITQGRCFLDIELLKGNVQADYVPHAGYFDIVTDDVFGSGMVPTRDWVLGILDHQWWLSDEGGKRS